MPAVDLTPYCAQCDLDRQAAAEATGTAEARAGALRDNPRKLATKTDIDGTKLCKPCFERRQAERRSDFLKREEPAAVAAADAPLKDA